MNSKLAKLGAIVFAIALTATTFFIPVGSVEIDESEQINDIYGKTSKSRFFPEDDVVDPGPMLLDRIYHMDPSFPINVDNTDDAGYRRDGGDEMKRSLPIYPGEPIDDFPGRSRTGQITFRDEDWFFFSACEGQQIEIIMSSPSGINCDLALHDPNGDEVATSTNSGSTIEAITYTALMSGYYFMNIYHEDGSGEGQYTFDISINGQNDAGTGSDAGDSFETATLINSGEKYGYLDMFDEEDWYKFQVSNGQGINLVLEMQDYAAFSDFDIVLYSPTGEIKYSQKYYYDDELNFNADQSGEWVAQVKLFPGYLEDPNPTQWDFFKYGSGAYRLEINIESSVPAPPGPIQQPDITPIAQTFEVINDPDSNKDEFGYLAAIPASNYIEGAKRYLSPIVYSGDDTITEWFGTVDDTTDYLLNDWNTYLTNNGKSATIYTLDSDPVKAAADIATSSWESSNLAVIAVDGSNFEDSVETVIQQSTTISRVTEVTTVQSDSADYTEDFGLLEKVGKEWGALTVGVYGISRSDHSENGAILTQIFPKYLDLDADDWPIPYDGPGDATDIYYPMVNEGYWAATSGLDPSIWDYIELTKIAGDRYTIDVNAPDSTIKVTVETNQESDLLVFLVDPEGHLRSPEIDTWAGPINPIHEWHGLENPPVNPWRSYDPEPSTERVAEVLHAEEGKWTAIVVPRYPTGTSSISYTVTGEVTVLNQNKIDAKMSAANAAVIASLEHAPLLYVTEDSVPTETQQAITSLGVNQVIFVENNEIGSAVRNQLPNIQDDLKTMDQIIGKIKGYSKSENYITITSLKSGDGYFAPAAMLAAYHGSPVLRIGDTDVGEVSISNRLFIGQRENNFYLLDLDQGKQVWSYPDSWTPEEMAPINVPNSYIYLGTTDDDFYCLDQTNGEMIWSYQSDYDGTGSKGKIYVDQDQCTVYCYDENDNEIWNEAIGKKSTMSSGGLSERVGTYRRWMGDYYHGIRYPGHLADHDEPLPTTIKMILDAFKYLVSGGSQGGLPPLGMDVKLRWNQGMHDGVYNLINSYGLDKSGQEAYAFVAPRSDIKLEMHTVMLGNNSYAGQIPGDTPGYTSAVVNRNILYPALVNANPNKDYTTTQLINFPDGETWDLNNGQSQQAFLPRVVKRTFSSHGRNYEGHCLWDALLERLNAGASAFYYSGHGTGGTGPSAQYYQTEHCNFPEMIWPDAWRGYSYDNWDTCRMNGRVWYNPEPPMLYDIIHHKWVDQLLENLRSCVVIYLSCSTGQSFGPMVFLDHGAPMWTGSAGSTYVPGPDLLDTKVFAEAFEQGVPIAQAYATNLWNFFRDYTTGDPFVMYGESSLIANQVHCVYGDPNLVIYSPDWEIPEPVEPEKHNGKEKSVNDFNKLGNLKQKIIDFIDQILINHPVLEMIFRNLKLINH